MILTGRAGLVALICVLPIAFSPWPATAFVVLLAGVHRRRWRVDVALAASTRRLRVHPVRRHRRAAGPAG